MGKVVSDDAVDTDWRAADIEVGPITCSLADIRMPLRVGDNTSRTWIVTPSKRGITLKHDHRHDDGSPDAVTLYGGTTADTGTGHRQEFPVDAYSIDLFGREGLPASVTNTWAMGIKPGKTLAYELSRPRTEEQVQAGAKRGRFFRIEFDVSKPVTKQAAKPTLPKPSLRFYLVDSDMAENAIPTSDRKLVTTISSEKLWLKLPAFIDETCLKSTNADLHPTAGYPILNFEFNDECAAKFAYVTAKNIGERFAVSLYGEITTAPTINATITNGRGFLEASFTLDSATQASDGLNAMIAKRDAK
jgi:hypothetical protein